MAWLLLSILDKFRSLSKAINFGLFLTKTKHILRNIKRENWLKRQLSIVKRLFKCQVAIQLTEITEKFKVVRNGSKLKLDHLICMMWCTFLNMMVDKNAQKVMRSFFFEVWKFHVFKKLLAIFLDIWSSLNVDHNFSL